MNPFARRGVIVFSLILVFVAGSSCGKSPTAPSVVFATADLRVGTGAAAENGKILVVDYTGWLYDAAATDRKGTQFDTSVGKTPFTFLLGAGTVIRGWDRGLPGARVGGLRRLTIPSDLAYGAAGAGNGTIPPNASLIFEIEILEVRDPPSAGR
jgi:FKBP-type peptidyl-prolyl cis-trans isomerase FkpA